VAAEVLEGAAAAKAEGQAIEEDGGEDARGNGGLAAAAVRELLPRGPVAGAEEFVEEPFGVVGPDEGVDIENQVVAGGGRRCEACHLGQGPVGERNRCL
jgi:hypothetical protein